MAGLAASFMRITRFCALSLTLALSGCASAPRNPQDPLEDLNRAMFSFNDKVDQAALKPAAEMYQSILPFFVQTTIGNFFGNLADIPTLFNEVLQGKFSESLSDFMRIAVNSTFGLGGALDIASEANLPKHSEDFGQTLGRWGIGAGPYVVLPILGPSTMRDTVATPIDFATDPWLRTYPVSLRNTGTVMRVVDQRSMVLNASNLVEEAALDRYEFVRDAYLQRRLNKIYDGDIPQDKMSPRSDVGADDTQAAALSMEPPAQSVIKLEPNAVVASPTTAAATTDETAKSSEPVSK